MGLSTWRGLVASLISMGLFCWCELGASLMPKISLATKELLTERGYCSSGHFIAINNAYEEEEQEGIG